MGIARWPTGATTAAAITAAAVTAAALAPAEAFRGLPLAWRSWPPRRADGRAERGRVKGTGGRASRGGLALRPRQRPRPTLRRTIHARVKNKRQANNARTCSDAEPMPGRATHVSGQG